MEKIDMQLYDFLEEEKIYLLRKLTYIYINE